MNIFETIVHDIGANAQEFKNEKMIILFGKDAPQTLADYCYIIEVNPIKKKIEEAKELLIDRTHYKITAVGSAVEKNLSDLGHITIKFDGSAEGELPGTLYVEEKDVAELKVGTKITII